MDRVRDVRSLPKAHLHLHFTGSMRPGTLLELADNEAERNGEVADAPDVDGREEMLRERAGETVESTEEENR